MTKDHGYVFEVDPHDRRANRDPKPVKAFGRYAHEAVVIDPRQGHAYLTEDASGPNGLLYRWTPPSGFRHGRGKLRTLAADAGVLAAAKCFDSAGRFVDDLSRATKIGTVYGVDWVSVPDRDARTVSVRKQFADGAVTRARKLEGMWWADGGAYFVSSYAREESPGAAHDGQVWFYDPKRRTVRLMVVLGVNADPAKDGSFDGPDNITVSPYGGLVIAEDGSGLQHLFGATESGRTYPLARNELNNGTAQEPEYSEFTGSASPRTGARCTPTSRTPASCSPSPDRGGARTDASAADGPEAGIPAAGTHDRRLCRRPFTGRRQAFDRSLSGADLGVAGCGPFLEQELVRLGGPLLVHPGLDEVPYRLVRLSGGRTGGTRRPECAVHAFKATGGH